MCDGLSCFRCVQFLQPHETVARQTPLSMGFSRQKYWSGLLFPSPGDLPDPGIKLSSLMSPALAGGFFITCATWKPLQKVRPRPNPWNSECYLIWRKDLCRCNYLEIILDSWMAVAAASSSLPSLTDGQLYYFVVEHNYVKQDSLSQDFAFSGSQCGDMCNVETFLVVITLLGKEWKMVVLQIFRR